MRYSAEERCLWCWLCHWIAFAPSAQPLTLVQDHILTVNVWRWQRFTETHSPTRCPWECKWHNCSEGLFAPSHFHKGLPQATKSNCIISLQRSELNNHPWKPSHNFSKKKNCFPHTINKFIWLQLNHIPLVLFSGDVKSGCLSPPM